MKARKHDTACVCDLLYFVFPVSTYSIDQSKNRRHLFHSTIVQVSASKLQLRFYCFILKSTNRIMFSLATTCKYFKSVKSPQTP